MTSKNKNKIQLQASDPLRVIKIQGHSRTVKKLRLVIVLALISWESGMRMTS